MKLKQTARGFDYREFKDANGRKCNMQISSAIEDERLLWLGVEENHIMIGMPWQEVTFKELSQKLGVKEVLVYDRMHLTQSQVKKLLPFLTKFAETGEIA